MAADFFAPETGKLFADVRVQAIDAVCIPTLMDRRSRDGIDIC